MTKKSYAKPNLTIHGNVETLTKGNADGNFLDGDFPAGTPKGDLGFSG